MNIGVISSLINSSRSSQQVRVCEDLDYVSACLDKVVSLHGEDGKVTFVSGGGRGPETLCSKYAQTKDAAYTAIPPRIRERGAMAFAERNSSIIAIADVLVVFWGGEDMYVAMALSEAMFQEKPVMIFPI